MPDSATETHPEPQTDANTASGSAHRAKSSAHQQFEKWALSYDRSRLNEFIFFPCIRRCQEEILRWQQDRGNATFDVLDVGCGTGTLISVLAGHQNRGRLVGLDYSPTMVVNAQRKFDEMPDERRPEAVQGDAEHLPFEDASFDVLTCCNSFHHYPNQTVAVAEFHRVLRPGGLLLLMDGMRDTILGWIVFDIVVTTIERHVKHVGWREMFGLLTAGGFEDIRQRQMNFLPPVLVNIARR